VTVCGLSIAPSVTVSRATRVPTAFGLKTTVTVHDAPAASRLPQVLLEITKSPGSVLVIAMLLIGTAAVPVLVSVADLGAPPTPTDTLAQLIFDGLKVRLPTGAIPVPERETFCGLLLAASVKLRVAVRTPTAAVLKRIVAVQLEKAARVDPQVLPEIAKSAALVPVMAMLVIATEDEVPLLNVAVNDCPLEPA
jgi:hypothetical protein